MTGSTTLLRLALLCGLLSSVTAHTHMFFPKPRNERDYQFNANSQNACENERTDITDQTTFTRGQSFAPKWFWNNHDGGFIKFALTLGVPGRVDNAGFLQNENIINGQCYSGGCEKGKFDPGDTHVCVGKNVTIPTWVQDGDYVFSFSSIGGFNSLGVATKALPTYHNCANIRIRGGAALEKRPANWIAPFEGGSKDKIAGKAGPPDTCGFKKFRAEPADASLVDVNNNSPADIAFGVPDGWAVKGGTPAGGAAAPKAPAPVGGAAPKAPAPKPAKGAAPAPAKGAAPAPKAPAPKKAPGQGKGKGQGRKGQGQGKNKGVQPKKNARDTAHDEIDLDAEILPRIGRVARRLLDV